VRISTAMPVLATTASSRITGMSITRSVRKPTPSLKSAMKPGLGQTHEGQACRIDTRYVVVDEMAEAIDDLHRVADAHGEDEKRHQHRIGVEPHTHEAQEPHLPDDRRGGTQERGEGQPAAARIGKQQHRGDRRRRRERTRPTSDAPSMRSPISFAKPVIRIPIVLGLVLVAHEASPGPGQTLGSRGALPCSGRSPPGAPR
jgi:hypothetical protein